MSDYHILEISTKGSIQKINVVFHIPIPATDNEAGVAYRDAFKSAASASAVPNHETDFATEYAAILNGEVYEHQQRVKVNLADTLVQKRDKVDARYTALQSAILTKAQLRFSYWGMDRDIP